MRINAWAATAVPLLLVAGCVSGCKATTMAQTRHAADGQAGYPYLQGASPGVGGQGDGPPAARPAGPSPDSFTVVATGDVLPHEPVTRQAALDGHGVLDYRAILAPIKPVISGADLAICHLEPPLGPAHGPFSGYPTFSVPPQIVPALADTGFDTCSTASNHSLDQGAAGIARTLDDLDAAGIKHTGTARSPQEAARPNILDVHGIKVAQLSFAFGFNGRRLPAGESWLANQISVPRILAAAHRARRLGAQVVIVSLHWGTEYKHPATAQQISLAQQLLASKDIDLLIGHHVHVVQPFARATNGKWVAYGLGNLVAAQHGEDQNEGLIARFTFAKVKRRWKVSRAEFIPTYIDQGPPLRVLDVPAELAEPGLDPARRAFLQGVQDRTSKVVYSRRALPTLAG